MMNSKIYEILPSLMLQVIDGEALLMDTDSREFYELNESGLVLWKIIKKHNSFHDVLNEILDSFEVSKEQAENDLNSFIDYLVKKNILEFHGIS